MGDTMIKGVRNDYKFKIENADLTVVLNGLGIPLSENRHGPMHSHDYAEIFACVASEAYIKLSDRIIALKKNECVIIPSGCIHRRIWNGKNFVTTNFQKVFEMIDYFPRLLALFYDLCKHGKWHKIQNGNRAGKAQGGLLPIIAY